MSGRIPKPAMTVSLKPGLETVAATVTLDGIGPSFAVTAEAWRSDRAPDPHIAFELALSRALSRLQHEIMESIHQRIDRATDDV